MEADSVLNQRFAALPENQQALLALCLDGGLDLPSAARALEISLGQAQSDLRLAIAALREEHGPAPLTLGRLDALLRSSTAASSELCDALDHRLPGAPCAAIDPEGPPVVDAPLQRLLVDRPPAFSRRRVFQVAAAILLLGAVGFAANWFWRSDESGALRVVSGRIRIDGRDATVAPAAARVENAEELPAVLRLDDGTRITLQPNSILRMRQAGDKGASVELESGGARVLCAKKGKSFSVQTATAVVTAVDAEFTVDLIAGQEPFREGDAEMSNRSLMALAVAVLAGSVSVQYDGAKVALTAGGSRIFAAEGKEAKGDAKPDGGGKEGGGKVDKYPPKDIALDDVPATITAAAQELVPGFVANSARLRTSPGQVEFWLEGSSGTGNFDVRVSASPSKVKKGDGGGDGNGKPKFKPEGDGNPPVKKFKPEGDGNPPVKKVKPEGDGNAPAKPKSKPEGDGNAPAKPKFKPEGDDGGNVKPKPKGDASVKGDGEVIKGEGKVKGEGKASGKGTDGDGKKPEEKTQTF